MKVFYRSEQSVPDNTSFSPSAGKPSHVAARLSAVDPVVEMMSFEPVECRQLYRVHARKYVDKVLTCQIDNGFYNRQPSVAKALPYVVGSMVAAATHAFKTGETALSLTSGFHHAGYDFGGGFCTFNGLVLAALEARDAGAVRVGIVDCDAHHGNGTVDIIKKLKLSFIKHYSYNHDQTRRQLLSTNKRWLKVFTQNMQDMARDCDLIIYNAGVDSHVDDPLSFEGLTTAEMMQRDVIVFRAAHEAGTPIVVSLAGGYQEPLSKVVALHINTYTAAKRWEP